MSAADRKAPWIPLGLTFMSGLPEAARRKRVLLPIQAWIDESGTEGQSRWFVMGGLIGPSEAWADFSERWSAVCCEAPAIKAFHFSPDARKRKGAFKGFSVDERDEKVRKLLRVLEGSGFRFIYCAVDFEAFGRRMRDKNMPPLRNAYAFSFERMITCVCGDLDENGLGERCEIFFDERHNEGLKIKKWYPILKLAHGRKLAKVLPIEPLFQDDEDFPPLQAVDLLVGVIARQFEDRSHELDWLVSEPLRMQMSNWSQVYDEDRINKIMDDPTVPWVGPITRLKAYRRHHEIYGGRRRGIWASALGALRQFFRR